MAMTKATSAKDLLDAGFVRVAAECGLPTQWYLSEDYFGDNPLTFREALRIENQAREGSCLTGSDQCGCEATNTGGE